MARSRSGLPEAGGEKSDAEGRTRGLDAVGKSARVTDGW